MSYGKENERLTDDEEISCNKEDLMSFKDFQHANRTNADLKKYQHDSMICLGGSKADDPVDQSGSDQEDSEEESCTSEPSNSASFPTENMSEDLSKMGTAKKKKPPIIRLIEIEGCHGAIGVVCEPKSPTRDRVHGIKFMEEPTEVSEQTESIFDDLSIMENKKGSNDPATDNEDISDLEYDGPATKNVPKYLIPEIKKTVKSIKTGKDGKTTSSENLIKLDDAVSLTQFVQEIETLSESDVCDWSEEEVKIVRRLSGDFGRLQKCLLEHPDIKKNGVVSEKPKKPTRKSSKDKPSKKKPLKIEGQVSIGTFMNETEKLSESDVSDWPEEEVKIVRRLSGDFGRSKNLLAGLQPANLELKTSVSVPGSKSSPPKPKKGRNRRRGKKKSGDNGQNKVAT